MYQYFVVILDNHYNEFSPYGYGILKNRLYCGHPYKNKDTDMV